jgi:hypothetical protein
MQSAITVRCQDKYRIVEDLVVLASTPSERLSNANKLITSKRSQSLLEDGIFAEMGSYVRQFSNLFPQLKENRPPGRMSIDIIEEMPKNNSKGPSNSGVAENGQSALKQSFDIKISDKRTNRRKSVKDSAYFTRPESLVTVKQ